MSLSSYWERLTGRYYRTTARRLHRRPLALEYPDPVISFTFDDFPRSALHTGGAILKESGALGTYYTSLGLMGKQTATGEMFLLEDLHLAVQDGHELGCHTFGHCDAAETSSGAFEAAVLANRSALGEMMPGAVFKTLSYPISPPRPTTKRRIAGYFECCRGGGQTLNAGIADLNYLASFFLEQAHGDIESVQSLIEFNRQTSGWLVFSTHDVCDAPTPYGCTPKFFEQVVRSAVRSGAQILPVVAACESYSGRRPAHIKVH